nr:S8 family peptidase [Brevundimonas sp. UBA5866]
MTDTVPKARAVARLRSDVALLNNWSRNGEPLRYGLGLYRGERLRPARLAAIQTYVPPPPPPPPPPIPGSSAGEYTRNWGVAGSNVYAAWQAGATGRGVTVAVVDSGIDMDHPDLSANISPLSTDVVVGRNSPEGPDRHGTRVASFIASPFNGRGTVGVAFNASIMSIRADVSDCAKEDQEFCFRSADLVRSIDYAIANGAKIVNMSLGGEGQLGSAFEAALKRGVDAGIIFAIAAGNEAGDNPEWPGRYASDPRFAGSIIVVGAHGQNGAMASFSNKAGVSQNVYISAPGSDVIGDCDDTSCWRLGGTSFASPVVAGAMALLKEAFPNLTGREIVEIILRTASDAGDTGTDTTWGRGKLDIAAAFRPIGQTSTPSATGATAIGLGTTPGTWLGGPFGDAMQRTGSMATIAYDEYERLFKVNAADVYRSAPRRSYQPETPRPMAQSTVAALGPAGTYLSLAAAVPMPEPEPVIQRYDLYSAPWMGTEDRREALFEVSTSNLSFAAWQGEGGARSPFRTRAGDGFASLAQVDHAVRGVMSFNTGDNSHIILSADSGSGDRRLPLQSLERDAATYGRMGLDWRFANGGLAFSLGQVEEKMGPLGTYMPMSSDLALPSSTRFTALGGDVRLSERLTLTGEVGMGRTDIDGRFLSLSQAAVSSSWNLGLQASCKGWWTGCSTLTWEISQPLRVESGTFEATLADIPLDYFDPVTFSRRRFSAAPSGRQIDMSMRSLHELPGGSVLQLEATAIRDEQHRRDAKPGYALMALWRRGF